MKGSTHTAAGICLGVSLSVYHQLPLNEAFTVIACSSIASLVPDLDTCTSKLGRLVAPASLLIQMLFGHRGLLHTPVLYAALLFLLSPILYTYPLVYTYAIVGGVALHLLLDLLNPKGIPLLWPLSSKHIHIGPFLSGGIVDHAIGIGVSAMTLYQIAQLVMTTVQSLTASIF